MKCIKAIKATKDVEVGEIKRVDNKTAYRMVGDYWTYISKTEWKQATRKPVEDSVEGQKEKKQNKKNSNPKKREKQS